MKLTHILANIDAIIKKHNSEQIEQPDPLIEIFTAYVLEKIKTTLRQQIKDNHTKTLDAKSAEQLIALIKEVYAVTANTDLVPPHNPHSLLTDVLLALSKQLATVSNLSRYEILIPTITVTEYEGSYMNISDADLQLQDFILNDAGTAVIEIFNSLSQASLHGELKHTYLVHNLTQLLSDTEQQRVINHSKESQAYWSAITERLDVIETGESYGAVLQRLVHSLRMGGISGKKYGGKGGQDYISGPDADYGIVEFFTWFNALSEADLKIFEKYPNIRDHILRLRYSKPEKVEDEKPYDEDDTTYCVELIGNDIELELKDNPELYTIFPENMDPKYLSTKADADAQVNVTETILLTALKTPEYQVTATYGVAAYTTLIKRIGSVADLLDFVPAEKCNQILSPQSIVPWLLNIPESERLRSLKAIKSLLAVIKFPSWDSITQILNTMNIHTQRKEAAKLFAIQIASFIATTTQLKEVGDFFGPHLKYDVYSIIYNANPIHFENNLELYFRVRADSISITRQKAISYLVTGDAYEADTIPFWQRLTLRAALAETADLKNNQLRALISLYTHGLRREHLRAYVPHGNREFSDPHIQALERLLQNAPVKISPSAAIAQISNLKVEEVARLPKISKQKSWLRCNNL
jgi:hypothetical protein